MIEKGEFILGAEAMAKLNEMDGKTAISLEGTVQDLTSEEVDVIWILMETNLPYISNQARGPALSMIKDLQDIAQRKREEELALDG